MFDAKCGSFNSLVVGLQLSHRQPSQSTTASHLLRPSHLLLAGSNILQRPSVQSESSVALRIAQSFRQQSSRGSTSSIPLPFTVAPFTRSALKFEHPTTRSFKSTSSPAVHHPPPKAEAKSHKRKMQEALSAQSFKQQPIVFDMHRRQPDPLDALLAPPLSTPPQSRFAAVHLDLNEPELDPVELLAPTFEDLGISGVRDSEGELFRWPWLQQQRGQIWSTPSRLAPHPLDRLINLGLDHASADGKRGRQHSGVRAWFAFWQDEMGMSPHRAMDPLSPLTAKLDEETLFMRFACALIRDRGVTVGTVRNYCSAVQGWHAREHGVKLAAGLKLERLPAMLKGLRRVFGDPEVKLRRGFAPQALRRAMDLVLDPSNPTHANYRAAIAVAFQGLLRSAEFCLPDGRKFNQRLHLTRADIKELTGQMAIIMITPCKNMKQLGGKTSPLVLGGGGVFIDACSELLNLLSVDPTPIGKADTTPLFRDPYSNDTLRYSNVLAMLRTMMHAIGENADQFGTHSLRIGGATALFACGADETVIRTMGRWSSDIHRLYVRACFERCLDWTQRAGSVVVTDVARIFDDGEDDDDDD